MPYTAKTTSSAHSRRDRAYPVLPLRDIVVFPHMIVPLFVGARNRSRLWKSDALDTFILLATQKNAPTTIRHQFDL